MQYKLRTHALSPFLILDSRPWSLAGERRLRLELRDPARSFLNLWPDTAGDMKLIDPDDPGRSWVWSARVDITVERKPREYKRYTELLLCLHQRVYRRCLRQHKVYIFCRRVYGKIRYKTFTRT